jgi:acetoin utilization deacetylase AcuC-like enzyme
MRVALVTHPASREHREPPGHPERQQRLESAITGVEESGLVVVPVTANRVDRHDLLVVHDAGFLESLERFCAAGGGRIDADTYAAPGSWQAALHSAGAGTTAVEALSSGSADVAFVATRPPGHHAERHRATGFCLLNNIAVTASRLVGGGDRVAIVDWDVHHGNGTQRAFVADPDVLYVSPHQFGFGFYPGTGRADEIGTGAAVGTTINLPMAPGTDGALYAEVFSRLVLPIVDQFEPDWVLVSAGYDAHAADPLADLELTDADFGWMAASLAPLVPGGRTVFFFEGGYDLDAVRKSIAATLRGHAEPSLAPMPPPPKVATPGLSQIVETLTPYWDVG